MAGLIAALFGGRARPPDPDPLPGQGGWSLPEGPYGATGYPGSTSVTRTFTGLNPRSFGVRAIRNPGITPVTAARAEMQHNSNAEFFGGPMLKTSPPVNDTAGGNPLTPAQDAGGHSVRDSETPPPARQPVIGMNTPGAANVRNTVAQDYKAVPGQVREYLSSPRGDLPPVNPTGQASDGNVHPALAVTPVMALSRFQFAGTGNQTWSVQRQMPYTGRGDGARGADLNGTRYYATWSGSSEFANAGQGAYGASRLAGPNHRPTVFTQPAPWSANYYDTTASTGTPDSPGTGGQAPDLTYLSPEAGRASNGTGRTG